MTRHLSTGRDVLIVILFVFAPVFAISFIFSRCSANSKAPVSVPTGLPKP